MGEIAETGKHKSLVFAVNEQKFELSDVDLSTTLLEFLRSQTPFKSVKLGCGEGGCGACVVLLSKYDPELDKVEDFTVSSCLTLLCSINGCSITTAEGVGNSKDGFHPIQKRLAGFHASQCGFCTPGMCVSLYSALVNADKKTNRPEPRPGFSKLTVSEAEKAISGNLCRCTGYRPIADTCKSFASDVDMEDLGFNSFWRKGESDEVKLRRLPSYNHHNASSRFPEFLKKEIKAGANLASQGYHWYSPSSLGELQSLLQEHEANDGTSMKIIVGNTGMGYYKELERYDKYIDLKFIPELSVIRKDQTGVEIGAAVTISKAIEALKEENEGDFHLQSRTVFKKIASHMEKIASGFVRNSGSVGGNLMMAQRKSFPSDIATVLLPVGTIMNIMTGQKLEKLTLEEFLKRPPLDSKTVLLSIKIPCWELRQDVSSEIDTKILYESYRAAPRPLGNALPYLNAAFLAEVSYSRNSTGVRLNNCQLAFGVYGTKRPIRARKVEEFLTGKLVSVGVLYEATKLLGKIVTPEDGTSHPAYRKSLAVGFLFEFLSPLIWSNADISGDYVNGHLLMDSKLKPKVLNHDKSCQNQLATLLSSGKQVIQLSKEYHPIGEPITKAGATIQASGEAVYVDDIPSPKDCLHGAFIYSTEPLARVKGIKFKPGVGVTALMTVKDIPGENLGFKSIFGEETLYADEIAQCAGDRIAFVLADTQKNADLAANLAVVDYDKENLESPILSVEEAVERCSFFQLPPSLYPVQFGDFSQGMAAADHQILSAQIQLGSQYYFYMETQTALAVPDEDNCVVVYSSNQFPEFTHDTIAKCLGVPGHNVRVISRRVGGGFGGKAVKAVPVATACALAAYKLQRPVRIYVNRKTDMIIAGGRHPMKITYSVGFKSNGKISALKLDILIDAGIYTDISLFMPGTILGALKKYDWGSLWYDVKICKTNLPSRSAMRAPGDLQGSFIAEAIIEHVASTLSVDVDSVRNINFHTHNSLSFFYKSSAGEPPEYTLPTIWDKLASSSSFYHRTEMVKEFNRCNKWQKRGISRVPIVYEVALRPTPGKVSILHDGSIVVEVGGIEIGQGLWTKVKQMTAYALSFIKCGGTEELTENVRVIQADTLSLIQGGMTAGSTTSESSCEAVRICCNVLVERLNSLKEKLLEQMESIEWETLISQAYLNSINLSASSYFVPDSSSTQYLNYGVAVSEVEVNLLTGETTILQTDILYDCGQSLNPAVDLGQIEGAYVQGIGFFMLEEYHTNHDGLVIANGTWTYKIPTVDTIPKQLNVEILNSEHHKRRVLSSKASGEPPLLLASSVHCATGAAIKEARRQLLLWSGKQEDSDSDSTIFQLEVPATMPVVKELCGLDSVERFLQWTMGREL